MCKVAIAGGTSGLGLAITEAILATKKHEVSPTPSTGLTHLEIDYTSPPSIAKHLKKNEIDTIILALNLRTPDSAENQLRLTDAATSSGTVRRLAPSEFALDYLSAGFHYPGEDLKIPAITKLKNTNLSYTRFICGRFMDYLLPSSSNPSHLSLFAILDFENSTAIVPGSGNDKVVFPHTKDVGAFVAASLELEVWKEASFIVGEKLSLNEVVAIAENIKGDQFAVNNVNAEDLKARNIPELGYNKQRYNTVPKVVVEHIFGIWGEAVVGGWLDFSCDNEENGNRLIDEMMDAKRFLGRG